VDGDLPHQHKTGGRVAIAGNSREQGVIVEEAFRTNAATILRGIDLQRAGLILKGNNAGEPRG